MRQREQTKAVLEQNIILNERNAILSKVSEECLKTINTMENESYLRQRFLSDIIEDDSLHKK